MDHKKMIIARHEAGHAVMALLCRQKIIVVSLKEMDSVRGTDKYLGFTRIDLAERKVENESKDAVNDTIVALAGGVSEGLFDDGLAKIAIDDLAYAVEKVEMLLRHETQLRNRATRLPIPDPGVLDMIEDPLIRACIVNMIDNCFERMRPLKPVIQKIADELLKREELAGDEVSTLFNTFMKSNEFEP